MSTAIEAHGLGKRYWVGGQRLPYRTLRETLIRGAKLLTGRLRREALAPIWALRDASFAVPQGRAVGVIGRNGAGKSTLLRILARITEPTTGDATIRGRVGSLLEIGTGFHPELSGRDNIFLSGVILGMSRTEIRSKFDQIVSFAELERFVDTPVKRYSSGMYTRLAFSVAAHLEPEILLVDEVLAVGDAAFQRKCLGRMRDVAGEGRTVLFVSHNMSAVQALCPQGLLLDGGGITFQGDIRDCVARYLEDVTRQEAADVDVSTTRRPQSFEPGLRIERLTLLSSSGRPVIADCDALVVSIQFSVSEPLEEIVLGTVVTSVENVRILECRSSHDQKSIPRLDRGRYEVSCTIRSHSLVAGYYFVGVGARSAARYLDWVPDALRIQVYPAQTGRSPWLDDTDALIRVPSEWTAPRPIPVPTTLGGAEPK